MSDIYTDTNQSIPPRYYDRQNIRIHFDDDTRRVEEIIEEEKKRETDSADEERRIEEEKILKKVLAEEEIKKKDLEVRNRKTDEENIEIIRKSSAEEVQRWLDYELIKKLEELQTERENQILEELDIKRRADISAAEEFSGYLQQESSYEGMNIDYFA